MSPQALAADDIYKREVQEVLFTCKTEKTLYQCLVDAPFVNKLETTKLDLGIVVLLLVNKRTRNIDRVALSNTEMAKLTLQITEIPFHEIKIPINDKNNAIARAIREQQPQAIVDWKYLFTPALSDEAARQNQANAGIECSLVVPFESRDGGAMIFSFYQPLKTLSQAQKDFTSWYANQVATLLKL